MQFSVSTLAILLPLVAASTIRVDVGLDGLTFSPNNIKAANGSTIEFHYHPKKHSVTQSSFAAPCAPVSGGINSGFVPVAKGESPKTFSVTVTDDTTPLWFYCAQTKASHCQAGMSMVVNEPTNPAKSLSAYQALAKLVPESSIGDVVSGGLFSSGGSASASGVAASASGVAAPSSSGAAGGSGYGGGSGNNGTVSTGKPTGTKDSGASATGTGAAAVSKGAAASGHVVEWAVLGGAAIVALAL